ncbi:protein-glutamate O-methyltransferase CheR [Candidatus Woesearchaeota archaeon]|nr:protein-glutamate O-methyltransferase CheR [Candidatus Woesearchaeota archaeon]
MDGNKDLGFEILKDEIEKLIGFECDKYSEKFLKRRIGVRMKISGAGEDYKAYAQIIKDNEEERRRLKKELTVHTTNFFRDKSLWELLTREIIPSALSKNKLTDSITIWSAGCSTGEEPLTIAICALEAQASSIRKKKIKIIATDIDPETIKKAQEARYEEEQFKEMEPRLKEKYFLKNADGTYSPTSGIRQCIEYQVQNILTAKITGCEMIFCRNTVIYLDLEAKRWLYSKFHKSLKEEGFLVLGKSEILQGEAKDMFQPYDNDERVYVRI